MEDPTVVQTPTMHQCPNCLHSFTGHFCGHCGQKLILRRTTLFTLYQDFLQIVFNVESMLVITIRELTFHPGLFFRHYLQGQRKRYSQPLQYFILTLTFYVFLSQANRYLITQLNASSLPIPKNPVRAQFIQILLEGSYYFEFLYPPILAFFFFVLFYKERINYAESLIFCLYLVSHILLLSSLVLPIAFIGSFFWVWTLPVVELSKEVIGLFFFVYASVNYSQLTWPYSLSKALLAFIASRIVILGLDVLLVNGIMHLNL